MRDGQGFGIDCLMRSHCRPQRSFLAFVLGLGLGLTLGCTITLNFVLHLEQMTVPSNDKLATTSTRTGTQKVCKTNAAKKFVLFRLHRSQHFMNMNISKI